MGNIETNKIELMNGLVISSVHGLEQYSEELVFSTKCGRKFRMTHYQDCCESVSIEDFEGDLVDLIGGTVISFTESWRDADESECNEYNESGTWTFYNIQTSKGSLNIRWLGESNGYYSEDVDFEEVK